MDGMGVGKVLLGAVVALAIPFHPRPAEAQTSTTCAVPAASPMAGHYTGPWQAAGQYTFNGQFATFTEVITLGLTVTGTLDLTVHDDGSVTGTASGTVDAPVYRDGEKDISSGTGTISGPVTGTLGPGGTLVLTKPIIQMSWGTFYGSAVGQTITMPNFTLPVGSADCVTGGGTVAETGFPTEALVADGTGEMTYAAGDGSVAGTWQAADDASGTFTALSTKVDAFIAAANSYLQSAPPTLDGLQAQVLAPLQSLEATIKANPSVARCLLERLATWEGTAVPPLYAQVRSLASSGTILGLRQAHALFSIASALAGDCSMPDADTRTALSTAPADLLEATVQSGDWPGLAAAFREAVLLGEDRHDLQAALHSDLHAYLAAHPDRAATLGAVAYAFGDDSDARAVAQEIAPGSKRKLGAALTAHLTRMQVSKPSGTPAVFSWSPVDGAQHYLVVVKAPDATVWSWTGSGTSATYGDTHVDGWPSDPPWTLPAGTYVWSVLALDGNDTVIAARLRMKP